MIGERIQKLMTASNKEVADLAKHCKVTPQAVYPWLTGDVELKAKRRDAIAEFFRITTQELEYTPLLSLIPLVKIRTGVTSKLDLVMSAHAADMMIAAELGATPKSAEYKNGMRDRLTVALSEVTSGTNYPAGTCQADAYNAGVTHGEIIISKLSL